MIWVYIALFALIAAAAYFAAIFVAPVMIGIAALIALGVALVEYATASASVFRGAATPIDHLKIAPPPESNDPEHAPEPAYRSYYFGPVFRDYTFMVKGSSRKVFDRVFGVQTSIYAGTGGLSLSQRLYAGWLALIRALPMGTTPAKIITWLPMAAGMVGLGVGLGVAALIIGVTSVLFGLVLAVVVAVAVVLALLLRLIETVTLRIRGITVECPSCHRGAVSPWYACPHCWATGGSEYHRRLIPGPLGTFHRVCRCGNKLPTLLVLGKWKLQGYCQHCQKPLPGKGLTAPTFHIPVVAGRSAGKSAYMVSAVAVLEKGQDENGFEFADASVIDDWERARDSMIDSTFGHVRVTQPNVPKAFNVFLGKGRSRRLLYLYDAAGELYENESRVGELGYLEHSGGVVIVIDPFSFSSVRRATDRAITDAARASAADADEVVGRFVEGLRRSVGGRAAKKLNVRAAVVITKCDALAQATTVPHPYEDLTENSSRADRSTAARNWISEQAAASGLVTSLENTFGRCRYFAVSALTALHDTAPASARTLTLVREDDVAAPVQWLMSGREVG
jgi:Double-GTPase 2